MNGMLHKKGVHVEVILSYPENTALLNQQLREDEGIPMPIDQIDPQPTTSSKKGVEKWKLKLKVKEDKQMLIACYLKWTWEQQIFDEIVVKTLKKFHSSKLSI